MWYDTYNWVKTKLDFIIDHYINTNTIIQHLVCFYKLQKNMFLAFMLMIERFLSDFTKKHSWLKTWYYENKNNIVIIIFCAICEIYVIRALFMDPPPKFSDFVIWLLRLWAIRIIILIGSLILRKIYPYEEDWYNKEWYNKEWYDKYGFDRDWYDRWWWTSDRLNRSTWTKYDIHWYNRNWFNRYGIHKDTWTKSDPFWYDKDWYDKNWWTTSVSHHYWNDKWPWINKETWTKYGKDWYNIRWYDERWFNKNWLFDGYGHSYYDNKWFDVNWYNREWYNKEWYDKYWWSRYGWNKKWINKYTWTKYDKDWYDRDWYDKEWFNKDWYDIELYDRRWFKHGEAYVDWYQLRNTWIPWFINYYYKPEYPNKYTWTKYDKDWYDYNYFPQKDKTNEPNKKVVNKKNKTNVRKNVESEGQIKICALASWSNWNCYYIWYWNDAILIDEWISYRMLCSRLKDANLNISSIRWVFISHEHSDHVSWLPVFHKNNPDIPIYFNERAFSSIKRSDAVQYRDWVINIENKMVKLGFFKIHPFMKKHDTHYPISYRIEIWDKSIWVFTDIGECDRNFRMQFSKCNAVFLETNYDENMLKNWRYPHDLKLRVSENHLSNKESHDLVKKYANPELKVIIFSHLSQNNNTQSKVIQEFSDLKDKYKLSIAPRTWIWEIFEI